MRTLSEGYTPTVEAFRGAYGQMFSEWRRDDALAEFDRFIARIKADANPKPRTITRAEFEKAYEARFMPDPTVALNVLGFLRELGIEVEDDE